VLTNDIDTDPQDVLTVAQVNGSAANVGTEITLASGALLTVNSDGSFTYVPPPNFVGEDTFTYRATDGIVVSNEATVTITVLDVNVAPVAVDDAYSMQLDDVLLIEPAPGVLGNDTDPDGDVLTAVLVDEPAPGGILSLDADGGFTFTPLAAGTFTFTYDACDRADPADPDRLCDRATVTITVLAGNEPPVAIDDAYGVPVEANLVVLQHQGVLANDTDPNGDPLTAKLVTDVANGTLALGTDGSFTYEPDPGFVGFDTFTYVANDGTLDSNEATVTIGVDLVTVDRARFRTRQGRWSLGGTMAIANETVTVYKCPDAGCSSRELIGEATTGIDGSDWSFSDAGATGAVEGDWVIAVSTSGAESQPVVVEVRR
jgi:hypothetical protein